MSKEKGFQTKYSPNFKITVIMDMRENHLSCRETVRKYWGTQSETEEDNYKGRVKSWERIYMEDGAAGLMVEVAEGKAQADRENSHWISRWKRI